MMLLRALATGPDLPVRTDIDIDAAYRRHRLSIIIAVTLGYAMSYTCRLALNVVKKPLIDGGIFTPDNLGTIGSALLYSYAAGKLINGFVSDHANARKFMALGLILSALCNVAMADRPRTLGRRAVADWMQDHYVAAAVPADKAVAARGVFASQLAILRIPSLWIVALASAMAYVTR